MNKEHDKNKPSQDAEILARLEKQLYEIETDEYLQDMTDDVLLEKGFIGSKPIEIPRTAINVDTEKEHLAFCEGVEFERLADTTLFDDLKLESFLFLRDVAKGGLIATRNADESLPFFEGNNVAKKVSDNKEMYYAFVKGKPVIIKNKLFIVPSDRDCTLSLFVDTSKMQVLLDCTPGLGDGKTLCPAHVDKALSERGIRFGIDKEKIAETLHKAEKLKTAQSDVCIATGKQPICGADGKVEFTFSTDEQKYDFKILPDGRIDYRNTQNIIMAKKDQLLATIIEPKAGIPGFNVIGEEVPSPPGKPAGLALGTGVRKSEDGTQFFAEINGSIILNGSVIEVVNTFVVNGDVDFSTGNINFNGNVIINGNVPDGFEIKADGDIVVAKIVESARLEAGRDVMILGGVQGKAKGLIAAGRDIRVGYAQNARLEAQGNIYIDNFAINSYLFTAKCLIMQDKRGQIVGGEVFAQRGLDVKVIGSENGVKTFIEVGTKYLVMRKIAELDNAIEFCDRNIKKINDSLKTVATRMKSGQKLESAMKLILTKAMEKKTGLTHKQAILLAKKADLCEQAKDRDTCFVKVKMVCFADVSIKIRDYKTVLTKPRENIRFFEDKKTEGIVTAAY